MTPLGFLPFLKGKWCGWRLLPPGFQFPVKELVASLVHLINMGELHKLSFFIIILKKIMFL
jgi:hypothetical protein